jgi:N12 class adenine-specific DNA methylase/GNAT superfamily N-acetyltransferase
LRKDERLKTIYEVIAPYITRNGNNWRDYLSFASRFYKHSFDNVLLVYAQKPNVTMLATMKQWNSVGRSIFNQEKGLAVCVYENAKLSIDHLFDISQTHGREIKATDWTLNDAMKLEMVQRLAFSHGVETDDFSELIGCLAAETVLENYESHFQNLRADTEGHLFSEIPVAGLEAQFIDLLTDSVVYLISKRCDLSDDEIHLKDGLLTINDFDTLPLIARLGNAVTTISKGVLIEMERTIKIINKERTERNGQTVTESGLHRERRRITSESANIQQPGERSTPRTIRQDGNGVSEGQSSAAVYDFENGWHSDGENAQSEHGSGGENRIHHTADARKGTDTGYRGHTGEDAPSEQPASGGGGNRTARTGAETEITDPPTETNEKESSHDGSFFMPYTPDISARWQDRLSEIISPLPFEDGLPNDDKVAAVKKWLKNNSDIYNPVYTVMYHATGIHVPVLEQGLLPTGTTRRRFYQSESGYVYLANTPERAKSFGDLGNNSNCIVYEIVIPINKLAADTDQLNNLRSTGVEVGGSLAESIVYGGGARIKGKIEQWQIKPFDYEGYRKFKDTAIETEIQAEPMITDEQVRQFYEHILTSTEMYPAELYGSVRALFVRSDLTVEQKAESLGAIYGEYGNSEYQSDVLYKTVIRDKDGEDGLSVSYGDENVQMPWDTVANIIEIMIDEGKYPSPQGQDNSTNLIGDYNIPDEVHEMGIPDYQNETRNEPEDSIAGARELLNQSEYAVSDELIEYAVEILNTDGIADPNAWQIAEQVETDLIAEEQEFDGQDTPKEENIRVIICRPMEKPLVAVIKNNLETKQKIVDGNITTIEFDENIDAVCADDVNIDNTPINRMVNVQPVYGTFLVARVDEDYNYTSLNDTDIEKYLHKFASHLVDITKLVGQYEEADQNYPLLSITPIEDIPKADKIEFFAPQSIVSQLTLFDPEPKSKEDELIEFIIGQQGTGFAGGKQRVYDFAQTDPTGSAFASFLKKEYGIGGGTVSQHGIHFVNYDSKGISFDWTDDNGEKQETSVTWIRAAIVVHRLIKEGRYLNAPIESSIEADVEIIDEEEQSEADNGEWENREVEGNLYNIFQQAVKAIDKIPSNEVELKDIHFDYHNGQHDFIIQAIRKSDDWVLGFLEYSEFEEEPYLNNIHVQDEYRRSGVGTLLIQFLQNKYHEEEIHWGMTTEDGTAFKEAVTYSVDNEEYSITKNRLDEVNEQLLQFESDFNTGKIFSDKQSEAWDDLIDEQQELADGLSELAPQKTYVRLMEDEKINEEIFKSDAAMLLEPKSRRPAKINFHFSEDYALYPNGAKTKYKNNIEAIKLLKKIEDERRLATADEQIILARYVGWGGLANTFSGKAAGWEKEYQELRLLLDENEYSDAMNSTITAYYTEPELIRRIYTALKNFGFEGGPNRKLLDPALGTGNFYSVLPELFADTKLYGAELDSVTGRIAKQLYQKADISVMGYEATRFEDNSFDVAVGNIPFNSIKVFDGRYDDLDFFIHDYFIAKTLDLVKPGGIISFITSKGTLDKTDLSVRKYIAERAEFIGAIRLPNTAFKALAGTEVTADIIFLKKRDHTIELSNTDLPEWVETEIDHTKRIRYNYYFMEHPEMLLGEMQSSKNMYGREDGTACVVPDGYDLYAELDRAVGNLHATFTAEADRPTEENEEQDEEAKYIDAPEGTKNYTYVVQDGSIFYCEKNKLIPQDYTGKKAERIKGLCEIRTALLEVIAVQSREYEYRELETAQAKLNEAYDRFIKKNGFINNQANILAFSDDDQFPLLRSIEDERKDKSGWDKAAIFTEATIKSYRRPDHADTVLEALQISLNEKMKVDLPYMAYLTGTEPEQIIVELGKHIYLNPHKYYGNYLEGWELAEEYLSGHVRDKLLYAKQKTEENPELFTRNVQALEIAQPVWLEPGDISVRIGAPWIPIEYYRQFMYETFNTPAYLKIDEFISGSNRIDIDYLEFTTTWRISNKTSEKESIKVNQTFGTKRINAYEIYEETLNLQSVTVRDPVHYVDKNGKDQIKYVVNANETMIARAKQNQIKEAFSLWLWRDKDRRDALLKIYNEKFNTIRPREYDGSHLVFPGMSNEVELRPHQLNFAARVIYSGTGLAAHEVGAGKTAALLAAGMYMKQIGTIKKPVYVVPNPLTSQWATEFYRFFPNANILVTTIKDFEKQNRNKFVSKIAMNDYDAIIIGHSQFERIPISRERQEAQLNKEINQISYAIDQIKREKGDNWAIKQMVIFQNNLRARLKKLSAEFKKDDLLTFEQLGIDFMFVDEAHYFKNCFSYTKMRGVAGVGKSASQRAFDMLLKCQYLQEINNGNGVVFATGTPISNSMSEMYVMQRYLQPQELRRLGLSYFDNWAATFGEIISSLEITPEGNGYRMRQRFAKFHNLPELMSVFKLVADIQTAEMLNLPTPEIEGGKPMVVAVEATPYQKMIMESFVERAEKIRNRDVDPSVDNMLKLTGEARLMAIDPRLVYENAPNDPNTKLNRCIEDAYSIWEETKEKRLTQLVFCDSGTPKPGKFNVYDEFKRILIKKGVPKDEIAFIHDAKTEVQREALFEKVRCGEIRIVLGSTSKLGTGVNVQNKLIAAHDLDCPWKPSDLIQRSGRVLRQGNENKVVKIRRYVTKGTFDAYLWQIQEQKLRFITQVMSGKSIARSCEDMDETILSAAEVKAVATDNPLLSEKMEVENEVARLKLLRGSWQNERAVLERNIHSYYPASIAKHQNNIEEISADIELLKKTVDQDFKITIDSTAFDERAKAGERLMLISKLEEIKSRDTPLPAGKYKGMQILLEHGYFDSINFVLKGSYAYSGDLGVSELGAIARIENTVERIPKLLEEEKQQLANFEQQLEEAKKEIDNPFEYEERLAEYAAHLSEINTKLEFKKLQKQEDVIIDEDEEQPDDEEYEAFDRVPACVGVEI